ncbi:hypothetical protein GPJ56_008113 [Histomonas meleagridis]|nr:hypothetical protein GPJ56_008113 [Histomonas meleagridis]
MSVIMKCLLNSKINASRTFTQLSSLIVFSQAIEIEQILNTNPEILKLIIDFPLRASTSTFRIRGLYCKILEHLILLSEFDFLDQIVNGPQFLQSLLNNLTYLSFYDFMINFVSTQTSSKFRFFEKSNLTSLLLKGLFETETLQEQYITLILFLTRSVVMTSPIVSPLFNPDNLQKLINFSLTTKSPSAAQSGLELLLSIYLCQHGFDKVAIKLINNNSNRIAEYLMSSKDFDSGKQAACSLLCSIIHNVFSPDDSSENSEEEEEDKNTNNLRNNILCDSIDFYNLGPLKENGNKNEEKDQKNMFDIIEEEKNENEETFDVIEEETEIENNVKNKNKLKEIDKQTKSEEKEKENEIQKKETNETLYVIKEETETDKQQKQEETFDVIEEETEPINETKKEQKPEETFDIIKKETDNKQKLEETFDVIEEEPEPINETSQKETDKQQKLEETFDVIEEETEPINETKKEQKPEETFDIIKKETDNKQKLEETFDIIEEEPETKNETKEEQKPEETFDIIKEETDKTDSKQKLEETFDIIKEEPEPIGETPQAETEEGFDIIKKTNETDEQQKIEETFDIIEEEPEPINETSQKETDKQQKIDETFEIIEEEETDSPNSHKEIEIKTETENPKNENKQNETETQTKEVNHSDDHQHSNDSFDINSEHEDATPLKTISKIEAQKSFDSFDLVEEPKTYKSKFKSETISDASDHKTNPLLEQIKPAGTSSDSQTQVEKDLYNSQNETDSDDNVEFDERFPIFHHNNFDSSTPFEEEDDDFSEPVIKKPITRTRFSFTPPASIAQTTTTFFNSIAKNTKRNNNNNVSFPSIPKPANTKRLSTAIVKNKAQIEQRKPTTVHDGSSNSTSKLLTLCDNPMAILLAKNQSNFFSDKSDISTSQNDLFDDLYEDDHDEEYDSYDYQTLNQSPVEKFPKSKFITQNGFAKRRSYSLVSMIPKNQITRSLKDDLYPSSFHNFDLNNKNADEHSEEIISHTHSSELFDSSNCNTNNLCFSIAEVPDESDNSLQITNNNNNNNHLEEEEMNKNEEEEEIGEFIDTAPIINTVVFMIDLFFEKPFLSFLHNSTLEIINTIYQYTDLFSDVMEKSNLGERILNVMDMKNQIMASYWGHLHQISELIDNYESQLKPQMVPKWENYFKNVYTPLEKIIQSNYGGQTPKPSNSPLALNPDFAVLQEYYTFTTPRPDAVYMTLIFEQCPIQKDFERDDIEIDSNLDPLFNSQQEVHWYSPIFSYA